MVVRPKFQSLHSKLCLVTWILAVFYAIYEFSKASNKFFLNYNDIYDDFTPGWSILGFRKRDKADIEWETVRYFVSYLYPFLVLYVAICEIIRLIPNVDNVVILKITQYFQILFTLCFLTLFLGYKISLIILTQPVVFALVKTSKSKIHIWICNLVSLVFISIYKNTIVDESFLKKCGINHHQAYFNIIVMCWINLKCTSISLTNPQCHVRSFLAYVFYFPTLFSGPFIPYEDFIKTYYRKEYEDVADRMTKFGVNVLRCVFWYTFLNFCLHYVYVNATSFQFGFVKKLDLCSLCGYGYLMGQFFHIKYIVLYGLTTSLASFENIPVPGLPRCIGRIHLYSDMWKYFDPGLHTFLKTYIFIPTYNFGLAKFMSSFLCFFFVYIWHGIDDYIFIWAIMNFIGVTLENCAHQLYKNKMKKSRFLKRFTLAETRRLKCALAVPLLAMSAISNFYFFAGKNVGDWYIHRAINESILNKAILFVALYCCCEVSTELRSVKSHRM